MTISHELTHSNPTIKNEIVIYDRFSNVEKLLGNMHFTRICVMICCILQGFIICIGHMLGVDSASGQSNFMATSSDPYPSQFPMAMKAITVNASA